MEIALVVCGKDHFPFGHLKLSIKITWQVQVQGAFRHVPEWTFGRLAVQFRPLPSVWAPKLLACLKTEYTTQIGFIVKRKNDDFSSGFRRFSVFHAFHGVSHGFPSFSDKNHCFDHLYQMHPALLNFICISTRRRAWRAKPKKSNDVGISHKKK